MRDTIYSEPKSSVSAFEFNEEVAEAFDDMISRSVPLYADVQSLTAQVVSSRVIPGTNVYDLGCSTGTTLFEIARALQAQTLQNHSVTLIGVDSSEPMLEKAREKSATNGQRGNIRFLCEDIRHFVPARASAACINYTLQFLAPADRRKCLKNIHSGLIDRGVVVITEKIHHVDRSMERIVCAMHEDFKKRNGYSELEIAQKREALQNVLVPLSLEENIDLLARAGFTRVEVALKWYNFVTLVAHKD